MREQRVRDAAQALRQRLGLGHGWVDPFEVLRRLDVEVTRSPIDGGDAIDGIYRPADHRGPRVFINSAKGLERQRFTAAHELGHHELDDLVTGSDPIIETDVLAIDEPAHAEKNWFAGSFLIDEFGAKQLYEEGRREDTLVAAAITLFDSSLPATAIELKRLDLITAETCGELLERRKSNAFLVREFLQSQGFEPKPDRRGQREFDPHYLDALQLRYERGSLSVAALGQFLFATEDEAREWLRSRGLAEPTPVISDEDALLSLVSAEPQGDWTDDEFATELPRPADR